MTSRPELRQFVGWAVSRNGGLTSPDTGALPLFSTAVAFVIANAAETDAGSAT